ncbi:DUF2058 family protein [Pseudomonas cavernae]|uniref:DUF2058 family protein n=1 Tax=Pseudomonas cavernae TaxID=2320867 RepID=A0A385Z088_9PSED|nr:DUF2058 family protein [Pseudomonas cavernae]
MAFVPLPMAQIEQLIEHGHLPRLVGEDYYSSVDEKIKRLPVNNLMRNKLSSGSLAIVHPAARK